jgi:hypothetical protein
VLKRGRPYVVLERNALDKLGRKRRKQGNIQNRIVVCILLLKNESVHLLGNSYASQRRGEKKNNRPVFQSG